MEKKGGGEGGDTIETHHLCNKFPLMYSRYSPSVCCQELGTSQQSKEPLLEQEEGGGGYTP